MDAMTAGISEEAIKKARIKHLTRQRFEAAGVLFGISPDDEEEARALEMFKTGELSVNLSKASCFACVPKWT